MLGSVTLSGGVESEVSSDVDVCSCWLELGCPVKLWVDPDPAGFPVSEETPLNESVMCLSVVSLPLALVDGALCVYSSVSAGLGGISHLEGG